MRAVGHLNEISLRNREKLRKQSNHLLYGSRGPNSAPPFTILVRVLYKQCLLYGSGYRVKKSVPPSFKVWVHLVYGSLLYRSCLYTLARTIELMKDYRYRLSQVRHGTVGVSERVYVYAGQIVARHIQ